MKDYNKPFVLDDTFTVSDEIKQMSREERREEIRALEEKARLELKKTEDNRGFATA